MHQKPLIHSLLNRRCWLGGSLSLAASPLLPCGAQADAQAVSSATLSVNDWTTHYGLSVFGELDEKADFKAFPYVRVDAPKGGIIAQDVYGAFNSMNPYILKGDAPDSMDIIFDTLMTPSANERDALYPLVAKSVSISPDKNSYRYQLRREARFHDGSPLTAKDVAFSLLVLRDKGTPTMRQMLQDIESATAEDDHMLLVRLAKGHSRDLPLIVARQPIFSSAYYSTRPFDETTLEPPLGSGPYRVGKFEASRYISYDRVPDYWGRDLPVHAGQNNFDVVRYEFFADRPVAFEAFKAGAYTVHEDYTAAVWMTGYDFMAVREKRVVREELPDANISGVQGWFFNTRKPALRDPRVREAFNCAFDFEWTNKNLMYNAYRRTQSYFENSDMKAVGLPDARELALLEPFRAELPTDVFTEPVSAPNSDASGQDRSLLKRASLLLAAAGCVREGGQLRGPDGKPIEVEFLDFSTALERHTQPFIKNLKLLGIDARMRIVDAAQYRSRLENFDFDIITKRLTMAYSPGDELRALFGSQAAGVKGSLNLPGVSDPVVDMLIAKAMIATKRDDLTVICRALDRVLRAGRYWAPHWFKSTHWIAHWDVFGCPAVAPKYATGIVPTWWWDEEKAKKIAFAGR